MPAKEATFFSFRDKLLLGIIFLSVVIPSIGGYYLVGVATSTIKDIIFTKSVAFTSTLARQIKPALEFDDSQTAKEISNANVQNQFIRLVRVWKFDIFAPEKQPTLFTESYASNEDQKYPISLSKGNYKNQENWLTSDLVIQRVIYSQKDKIGVIQVVRSLNELKKIQGDFQRLALTLWLVLLLLVFIAALWLEKSLTKPLRKLVLVAEKISSRNDLLIRAKKISNDEFGKLTSMFNKMLDSIRETNQRLVASNIEMESRVKERTNDIKSANDKLKKEIKKRIVKNQQLILLQNQLGKQEKFASVGQVSSNIAHELRNPMAAIRNSVYFLRNNPLDLDKSTQHLDIIDQQLSESDKVIKKLLELTKGKPLDLTPVKIKKLCFEALTFLDSEENTEIRFQFDPPKLNVIADKIIFRQILLNLFLNSIQAKKPDEKLIINILVRKKGDFNEIEISDNGTGIPKEIQNHIFEPLYSSKEGGFGLGLSMSSDFIARHKGTIEIKDTSKKGTTFLIKFPN